MLLLIICILKPVLNVFHVAGRISKVIYFYKMQSKLIPDFFLNELLPHKICDFNPRVLRNNINYIILQFKLSTFVFMSLWKNALSDSVCSPSFLTTYRPCLLLIDER